MKLVLAMMKHETNTFSPIVTDWARFEAWGLYTGQAAIEAYAKTNMPLGVYLNLAKEYGAEVVLPMAAEAMPGGKVTADAYKRLTDPILEAVRQGCDGCLLDLHGAMVAEGTDDGEGTLLEQIRRIAPDLPIAVTLDLHCNLTPKMVENCTALIGYKTYPHVDMDVVAGQVGRVVMEFIAGKRPKPAMALRQLPLLSQTLCQGTDDEPMKSAIQACRNEEARGLPCASVFGGFALADFKDAGTTVITVGNDQQQADAAADAIAAQVWDKRDQHVYRHRDLAESVAKAKQIKDGPVILLDHADNCGSGGTQDVMMVIEEVLRQGLEDVAVGAVWDPEAVQIMQKAGVGATVTLELGGKTDMPSLGLKGRPLKLTGKVRTITDGEWIVRGPMYNGYKVMMGPTAVLEVDGRMQIVVVSRHHEPWDTGVFTSVGIDPQHKRYLLLKSRIHYRAGFAPLARATFTLDGEGVTTSDNSKLKYEKLRRPIYPLDRINDWQQ
ncbi:MAG TPA: M81 family metallopeptidase [Ferrovibrio sp.]|uniref:M81 family metallopeptidase n=1 Tax=Ferrovibrio sp. TaxID=1917215 RepID=UPI002B4B4FA2|nr:M81 family metallopeptidase [Ferrovibrio sp.]HLT77044.1 M81 family metallopeptidase [Ferrovibrio sp.]